MPVKNQERWVAHAIRSVLPWVDEFVVVDDASTDRTISKVRNLGIDPILTEGKNTSSELRNIGARCADADWIWVVDSDEVYTNANAERMRERIEYFHKDSTISMLEVKWINFIRDRFHWDGNEELKTIRAYRRSDIFWYSNSLQEAPARSQKDLVLVDNGSNIGVKNTGDYTALLDDVCFYHYSRCDNLLDRLRKWCRYISISYPDMTQEEILEKAKEQEWVVLPSMQPFNGPQPEVFYC